MGRITKGVLELGEGAVGILDQVGQRISTRFPTAVKAEEDPLRDMLIIDADAMRAAGEVPYGKNADIVGGYNSVQTRARKPESRVQAFHDESVDNLLWLYDQVPGEVRDISRQWYVGANRMANDIAQRNGISTESASGVIAALSPQKDWYQNASLAERLVDIAGRAGRGDLGLPDSDQAATLARIFSKEQYLPDVKAVLTKPYNELTETQKAMYVRSFDETFNDRRYNIISPTGEKTGYATTKSGNDSTAAWGSNVEIGKAIGVLEDPSMDNISRRMGEQHKVRNFYNNIADPRYSLDNPYKGDVTIDTHAVAADMLQPFSGNSTPVIQNFGGGGAASSAVTGSKGTYGLHADAYRAAAAERGVQPREMQSITWEAVRSLFPASFKTKKNVEQISGVWDLYRKGKISKDDARDLIMEKSGGMDAPDWFEGSRGRNNDRAADSVDQGKLHRDGVSGETGSVDGRTRLIAAGVPAAWLGLGGAGVLAPEEAEASFIGQAAKTFSRKALQKAQEMEELGFSRDAIWKETGQMGAPTFKDVDGHWKQEIDDSGMRFDRTDLDRYDYVSQDSVLQHDGLFEAYPWLRQSGTMKLGDGASMDGLRGSFDGSTVHLNTDRPDDAIASTNLHELQHAIQHNEGFARGGNNSQGFTQAVRQELSDDARRAENAAYDWRDTNMGVLAAAESAADKYRAATKYADYEKLIEYANHPEPTRLFRHIRNQSQWLHSPELRDNPELRDRVRELDRRLYDLPKKHKKAERTEFLRQYSFDLAQVLRSSLPDHQFQAMRESGRDAKGLARSAERAYSRANGELAPLRELERAAKDKRNLADSHRHSLDHDVYRHLAGEAEARNVQTRINMGMGERIETPPWRTLDVDEGYLIPRGMKPAAGAAASAGVLAESATAEDLVNSVSGPYSSQIGERAYSAAAHGTHSPDTLTALPDRSTLANLATAIENNTQSPLGESHFQGIVDLLRKWGYSEQADVWDYGAALLDVAP